MGSGCGDRPAACYIGDGEIMINALLLFAFRKDEEIGMIIGKKDYVVFIVNFQLPIFFQV